MAQIHIHAKRFGETEEERSRPIYNDHPAIIPVKDDEEVIIKMKNSIVHEIRINGKMQEMIIPLREFDYTALCLVRDVVKEKCA